MTHFGKLLRHTLVDLDVRQHVLAERLGVSATYVSGLARGHKRPSPGMVNKIADALDVEPEVRRTLHQAGARDAGWRI